MALIWSSWQYSKLTLELQKLRPWVNSISKIPVDGKWWSLGWSSHLQIPRVTFIRPPDTASPLHLRRVCNFWKLSLTLMPGPPCPIFSSFLCPRNSISSGMDRNRDFSQEAQTLSYLPVPVMFAIVVVVQSLSCFWLFVTPGPQASLSFIIIQSSCKLTSIGSMILSNHLAIGVWFPLKGFYDKYKWTTIDRPL